MYTGVCKTLYSIVIYRECSREDLLCNAVLRIVCYACVTQTGVWLEKISPVCDLRERRSHGYVSWQCLVGVTSMTCPGRGVGGSASMMLAGLPWPTIPTSRWKEFTITFQFNLYFIFTGPEVLLLVKLYKSSPRDSNDSVIWYGEPVQSHLGSKGWVRLG